MSQGCHFRQLAVVSECVFWALALIASISRFLQLLSGLGDSTEISGLLYNHVPRLTRFSMIQLDLYHDSWNLVPRVNICFFLFCPIIAFLGAGREVWLDRCRTYINDYKSPHDTVALRNEYSTTRELTASLRAQYSAYVNVLKEDKTQTLTVPFANHVLLEHTGNHLMEMKTFLMISVAYLLHLWTCFFNGIWQGKKGGMIFACFIQLLMRGFSLMGNLGEIQDKRFTLSCGCGQEYYFPSVVCRMTLKRFTYACRCFKLITWTCRFWSHLKSKVLPRWLHGIFLWISSAYAIFTSVFMSNLPS